MNISDIFEIMRLFKTLPLPNSTYSSCREYYNNTNDNIKKHSVQYHSSSNNIFFPTNLRDYVAAHHDNARAAHVHGVSLETQLALPLWIELSVLHGPEHCHWSVLRVRVWLCGRRELDVRLR